jgi:hypothetical protein
MEPKAQYRYRKSSALIPNLSQMNPSHTSTSYSFYIFNMWAGIAQSGYRRVKGWKTGVRFPAGAKDFSHLQSVETRPGTTYSPIQWFLGALSLGIKWPKREANHSPPFSAEDKNNWSMSPMLQAGRSRVWFPMRWIFFNWPNPSSRTVVLGSTQPLTEMSTRKIPGGGGG